MMNVAGLMPDRALWVFVVIVELFYLLCYLVLPLTVEKWPYIAGKYESAASFHAAKLSGMILSWLIGAPLLVARFLVGVAILRFVGWL